MAKKSASQWENEKDPWFLEAEASARALLDRPAFSYDPAADPLYREARSQALLQGRLGMEDAMGKAAGLSGGYASSYAQSLGQQHWDAQLSRMAQLLPDYYDRARAAYDKETGRLKDELSAALGLYDKNYKTWLDRQNAEAKAAGQAASAANTERSYAYRMAMLALQRGLKVSSAMLKTAGIDAAYAETIRRYFAGRA